MGATEKIKLLVRGDTASNWEIVNPILGKNEIAVEWDTNSPEKRIKIGDGASPYTDLPYTANERAIKLALDAEAAAREEADVTLQENIDAVAGDLDADTGARKEADAALQENIDAEATAREEADTALQESIDAETTAREEADTALQENIDAEATAREEADTALQESVDAETTAREEADTALQENIDAEATARGEADTALSGRIDDEAAARGEADATLQENIDTEATARGEADTALSGRIDAEAAAREEADTALQENIDAEAGARGEADTALSGRIDAETTARGEADATLQENIDAEATARGEADATLQESIDAEAGAREEADAALSGRIDDVVGDLAAEAGASSGANSILQENIDAVAEDLATEVEAREAAIEQEISDRNAAITAASLATQTWIPAVPIRSDLPDAGTLSPSINYLCRVMADTVTPANNGVWQLVAGMDEWTYFSDNLDFVDETELDKAISAADAALQESIAAEATARGEADTALSERIDNISGAQDEGGAALQENIDAEATARGEADTALSGRIDDEAAARGEADAALQENIDAEATAREEADTALSGRIDAETTARGEADATLQENIDAEAGARGEADATLQENIDAEAGARGEADAALQENIDAEATARDEADAALSERIDNISGSQGEGGVAQESIDAEAAARGEADAALQENIDAEATAREEADAAILTELTQEAARAETAEGLLQDAAEAAQGTADAALPKSDVVAPDGSATAGQAADAAALNAIIAGLVKLASTSTQEVFSNLALKTYVDPGSGQTKAFQLLGTAIDGTEHTLIELAEYGAAQQIEIGSETIHLNLNTLGPVGGDNHITCDTHDSTGAAVKLSVAWLTDVVTQCAATLAGANDYTDDRLEQMLVDALILQNPCKESELPAGPFADPSHNGYFYQITDFDVSYPGKDRKGSATWYDSMDNYYLAVDTYKNADEDTITENSNGEFMVKDVETGTIVADTGGFANSVTLGFKAFIAAVIAKINGLFSLVSGLSAAIGLKYTKPSGGIPTGDLALTQGQGDALNSGITAALVSTFGGKQDALSADQLAAVNSGITDKLVEKIGGENGNLSYIFNTEDDYLEARDSIPDGSRILIIEG